MFQQFGEVLIYFARYQNILHIVQLAVLTKV